MNEQPHKSPEPISVPNTTHSWRAMRNVFCLIVALFAGVFGGGGSVCDEYSRIQKARITVAETEAIRAESKPLSEEEKRTLAENGLVESIPAPEVKRRWDEIQKTAAKSLTLLAIEGIGLGILISIGGWIGAWLFVIAVAFVWWFLLDRIREFSRAVKGQQ